MTMLPRVRIVLAVAASLALVIGANWQLVDRIRRLRPIDFRVAQGCAWAACVI